MYSIKQQQKSPSSFVVAFLLFPFFDPNIIGTLPSLLFLNGLIRVWQVIAILAGLRCFLHINNLPQFRKSHIPFILLFSLCILFSTLRTDGDSLRMLYYVLEIIAIFSIFFYYGIYGGAIKKICNVMFCYYSILMFANLITMILYPNGQDKLWVLGNKNNIIYYGLPYLLYAIGRCKDEETEVIKKLILPFGICIASTVIGKSSTSTVAFLVVFMVFLIQKTFSSRFKIRLDILYLSAFVLSLAFILVSDLRILDSAIAYFQKEESFGRFVVWEKSIDYLNGNMTWGLGLETIEEMEDKFGYSHCHNKFLDVLYIGGCIGLATFILAMYKVFRVVDTNKKITIYSMLIVSLLSAYAIEFLMEAKRGDIAF